MHKNQSAEIANSIGVHKGVMGNSIVKVNPTRLDP